MIRINEDRSLYGEEHGTITTNDGEIVTWKGQGVGKMKGKGIESRGSPFYNTSSKKLSRLNNLVGVYEHHMDELGNFETEIWEWSLKIN